MKFARYQALLGSVCYTKLGFENFWQAGATNVELSNEPKKAVV
jgi:hypothetical protein